MMPEPATYQMPPPAILGTPCQIMVNASSYIRITSTRRAQRLVPSLPDGAVRFFRWE
jgi:hypothetical protein